MRFTGSAAAGLRQFVQFVMPGLARFSRIFKTCGTKDVTKKPQEAPIRP